MYDVDLIRTQSVFISSGISVSIIVLLALAYFYKKKLRLQVLLILFSTFSYVLSLILKFIFKAPRPLNASYRDSMFDYYSFPSTHSFLYTAVLGYILYCITFRVSKIDKLFKFVFQIFLSYLIIFVGFSRVYLEEHWIKDVIWGYIFGLLFLGFLIFLDKKIGKSVPKYKN